MATGNYQMGDAVLCGDGEFRRLVGTVEDSFIARGDGEGEEAETLLTAQDVKGEVLASLPGAGLVMDYLSAPWGAPSVLVVGILLVVLPSLLGLDADRRDANRRDANRRPPSRKPGKRRANPRWNVPGRWLVPGGSAWSGPAPASSRFKRGGHGSCETPAPAAGKGESGEIPAPH